MSSTSLSPAPQRSGSMPEPGGRILRVVAPYALALLLILILAAVAGGWTGVAVVGACTGALMSSWLCLFTESGIGA